MTLGVDAGIRDKQRCISQMSKIWVAAAVIVITSKLMLLREYFSKRRNWAILRRIQEFRLALITLNLAQLSWVPSNSAQTSFFNSFVVMSDRCIGTADTFTYTLSFCGVLLQKYNSLEKRVLRSVHLGSWTNKNYEGLGRMICNNPKCLITSSVLIIYWNKIRHLD